MRFGILGPLIVSHEGRPVAITGRRPRAVLACLLLRRGHTIPDDALIARGSMAACRDHGEVRLEGKEYIVQDGDIINFRFAT